MVRRVFYVLVFSLLIVPILSCENDDDGSEKLECNVENPITDLDWLKEVIAEVKEDPYAYYNMATYEGKTVFYYGNCDPAINYVSYLLNCKGNRLGFTNDYQSSLEDIAVIWKPEDSVCNFPD